MASPGGGGGGGGCAAFVELVKLMGGGGGGGCLGFVELVKLTWIAQPVNCAVPAALPTSDMRPARMYFSSNAPCVLVSLPFLNVWIL